MKQDVHQALVLMRKYWYYTALFSVLAFSMLAIDRQPYHVREYLSVLAGAGALLCGILDIEREKRESGSPGAIENS